MDKKAFLLNKSNYSEEEIKRLTEIDLEKLVEKEDYDDDYSIIKLDANGYNSISETLKNELSFIDFDDFFIISFGF